jgi:DNA replication protein DnaC
MAPATKSTGRDLSAEVAFLTRALKAPTLRARESHGGEGRIRAARFPARKSVEEFDFDHARRLKRDVVAHLGTLDFVALGGPAGPALVRWRERPRQRPP